MSGKASLRCAARADVDRVLDWAAAEGWNPGRHDARAFHAADPEGFFVSEIGGSPAASISVVRYDASYAFLGLYIVRPEARGKGIGFALWREALARRSAACIGLDGVVAQQANYAKSGFALAYRNIRYGGTAPSAGDRMSAAIVDARALPFDTLAAYDRRYFPAPRPGFLSLWLDPPDSAARAVVEDGCLRGLGAIRPCREGYKIGPLYAEDETAADALFRALSAEARGARVFLDVPEPNAAAAKLASRYGLSPAFETARMYAGAAPSIPLERLFGVTTFELG